MVLSNLSSNMDVESRTMVTMGDTLGASECGASTARGRGGCPGRGVLGDLGAHWGSDAPSSQLPKVSWTLPISATSWPNSGSGFTTRKLQSWS